jgi:signal peptidase I
MAIHRRTRTLFELALTVAVAVGLAFAVQAWAVKPYKIPTTSMLPALEIGQRILVNRLIDHPSVGDIVVFHPPAGADPQPAICANPDQGAGHSQACDNSTRQPSAQTFVKRVVAGPGDVVRIINGHVYRNGVRERDTYTVACGTSPECNFPTAIRIPSGDYYMMGDNRPDSDDSRFWGPVPNAWIIGVAFFTYWPPDRIGSL